MIVEIKMKFMKKKTNLKLYNTLKQKNTKIS